MRVQHRVVVAEPDVVVEGVEGLVIPGFLRMGHVLEQVRLFQHFLGVVIHAGQDIAGGQVQGGVSEEVGLVQLQGQVLFLMGIEEGGVHVEAVVLVEQVIIIMVQRRAVRRLAAPLFQLGDAGLFELDVLLFLLQSTVQFL